MQLRPTRLIPRRIAFTFEYRILLIKQAEVPQRLPMLRSVLSKQEKSVDNLPLQTGFQAASDWIWGKFGASSGQLGGGVGVGSG